MRVRACVHMRACVGACVCACVRVCARVRTRLSFSINGEDIAAQNFLKADAERGGGIFMVSVSKIEGSRHPSSHNHKSTSPLLRKWECFLLNNRT